MQHGLSVHLPLARAERLAIFVTHVNCRIVCSELKAHGRNLNEDPSGSVLGLFVVVLDGFLFVCLFVLLTVVVVVVDADVVFVVVVCVGVWGFTFCPTISFILVGYNTRSATTKSIL